MNSPGILNQSRQAMANFWLRRDARERTLLSCAAATLVLALFYALLIDPALSGREQLYRSLPVLRQQVAQMQALSREAADLSGKLAAPPAVMSEEAIKATLARKGMKAQDVLLSGGHARVQLNAVSFAATLEWLVEVQRNERLIVVDANITALAQPDTVDAVLTLRQPQVEPGNLN